MKPPCLSWLTVRRGSAPLAGRSTSAAPGLELPGAVGEAAAVAGRDLDLPEGGRQRRVAGLRREEVAQLAAISTDYYTRLEQGRIHPSAPVLGSLAQVLRLDDDQRTYLYELAGTNPASAKSRRRAPQKIKPYCSVSWTTSPTRPRS
jgi:DNA-binding XRE family transcriptional regulator